MREREQIPRNSLAWMLAAQAVILAPHGFHMPVWLWGVWLLAVFWRWQIFRGAWSFPRWPVKSLLVAVCCGGLILVYRGSFGMETMISLLIVGFVLKLLEVRNRRDFLLLCHLAYFVAATQFLFFSNLPAALYGLLSVLVVSASLLASYQSLQEHRFWRTLRLTSTLVLQALPLMLILFFLVPRVGSLWSVPLNTTTAKSGMSDSMAPGDFSQLMRSRDLAFRVTFEGDFPPPQDLYWRGLVFSAFDGRSWSQTPRQRLAQFVNWAEQPPAAWRERIEALGRATRYQIMLEPTQERWLYALSAPIQWEDDIGIGQEFRLQRQARVRQRIQYRVTSSLDYRYEAQGLDDWQRRQELQLPAESNPRTRAEAERWRQQAGSPEALIARLLDHYRASFRYTLQPGVLGAHPVDEFLWHTQAGFCEHFASSFVFFMRAAGIPARVVVGYQGGEINPLENYLLVRQYDAHAWAEVWLEGQGWVRVDPTAAVAPERIERGIEFSLDELDSRLLSHALARDYQWLNQLRLRWDLFNYNWNRWVLGYDTEVQRRLLSRWLGGLDPWRLALAIIGLGGLVIALVLARMLWRQRRHYALPEDRQLARWQRKLARAGYPRALGEPVRAYAERVAQHLPQCAAELRHIAALYELASYAGNRAVVSELRAAVTRLRVA